MSDFLGSQFYTIPCGAVPKNNDPAGRIIHNYSYPSPDFLSINAALTNTSVSYITFKERVKKLANVDWYIKADLKNGYRQMPVNPVDWHTQVYALGPDEYYLDLSMPFGKANSSKNFCNWTSAWCYSFQYHFYRTYNFEISLSSYVDDFFGGQIRSGSLIRDKKNAKLLLANLILLGKVTNTVMNVQKCKGPARKMDILGIFFDSIEKACFLSPEKRKKYIQRVLHLKKTNVTTSKKIEKIVGNLTYAAWVMPFGRPFISHIAIFIDVKKPNARVKLDAAARMACDVWLFLLKKNRGLPFNFILGLLPKYKYEWFVDASTSFGYGGICGRRFFPGTTRIYRNGAAMS